MGAQKMSPNFLTISPILFIFNQFNNCPFFLTKKSHNFRQSVCRMVRSPILLLKSWFQHMHPVCLKKIWVRHVYFQHIFKYFFGSLVNETFSNLKFNVFIITGSIFSNRYVKQVVFIKHSWIIPTLQKGWGLEFYLFFRKWERVHFSRKRESLVK